MTKCRGCGIDLQCSSSSKPGYIRNDKINTAEYCENCFKTIHYSKTSFPMKPENLNVINEISLKLSPVIYIIDVLNITEDAVKYLKEIKSNKIYVILNKIDLLPKGIKEGKIIKYFKNNYYNNCDVFCVSSKKKHNIEKVYETLKKEKIDHVYIIGLTNAGKSSFINSVMSLKNIKPSITTSSIPNTTYSYLNINIDGIEFIDTPGFEPNSIHNFLTNEMIKEINPKKEIKVKTFQIRNGYSIIINDIVRIDYLKGYLNSFNFYMNEYINYKKVKTILHNELITLPSKTYELDGTKDIVINGLGFIKINKPGIVKVYSLDESIINIRNKMI